VRQAIALPTMFSQILMPLSFYCLFMPCGEIAVCKYKQNVVVAEILDVKKQPER
jgi:hypothetical protein